MKRDKAKTKKYHRIFIWLLLRSRPHIAALFRYNDKHGNTFGIWWDFVFGMFCSVAVISDSTKRILYKFSMLLRCMFAVSLERWCLCDGIMQSNCVIVKMANGILHDFWMDIIHATRAFPSKHHGSKYDLRRKLPLDWMQNGKPRRRCPDSSNQVPFVLLIIFSPVSGVYPIRGMRLSLYALGHTSIRISNSRISHNTHLHCSLATRKFCVSVLLLSDYGGGSIHDSTISFDWLRRRYNTEWSEWKFIESKC